MLQFLSSPQIKFNKKGFSLVETLVGVALIAIVFVSIYGGFQGAMKIITRSKIRITATALANQKIEIARNLPYNKIGTQGGVPSGDILETENITRNGVEYTVKTTIGYIDDPFDGLAPTDSLPNDYKRVKVKVSWTGALSGQIISITDIAPKGLETSEGGGNMLISVFDALGMPIPQANIHIVNNSTDPPIDANYQTNDQGEYLVAGAPSSTASYQITVTKTGYSTERTYSTTEVANPGKPHATVLEGELTEASFPIDLLGGFSIDTFSTWSSDSFADSFSDESKVSEKNNIKIANGQVNLATSSQEYLSPGYLLSLPVEPTNLINWDKLSFNDNQPTDTEIRYHLFYATSSSWWLVPDTDLTGNSSGFLTGPVDLSDLSAGSYPKLKIKADLSTSNTSTSPAIFDWNLSWITDAATPIGNVSFNLKGAKIIGTDGDEQPVYKYSNDFTTNSSGHLDINNLEWDNYNFTINPSENLDLVATSPSSTPAGQEIQLLPDTNQSVSLFLEAENSLLATVRDSATLTPLFSAQVRVYNTGLGYDQNQLTNEEGKTIFIPLDSADYNIEVEADDYQTYSGSAAVSGDDTIIIDLVRTGPS